MSKNVFLSTALILMTWLAGPAAACDMDSSETAGSRALGNALKATGRVTRAQDMDQVQKLKGERLSAYLYAGQLIMAELERDPYNPVHYSRLALTQNALGRYSDAIAILNRGLAICPGNEHLLRVKAMIRPKR